MEAEELASALSKHSQHKLFAPGDVIVTHAGALPARYLFTAVVVDWAGQHESGKLIAEDVVTSAARRCIRIAAALELESIAFAPWGTRAMDTDPAKVTAWMVNAIVSQLQDDPGSLQRVFLVSINPDHYEWFVDRAFVFQLLFDQVVQIRRAVASASYAARAFGVRWAMPTAQALRLCPQTIVLPPRHKAYREYSARMMAILSEYSPPRPGPQCPALLPSGPNRPVPKANHAADTHRWMHQRFAVKGIK